MGPGLRRDGGISGKTWSVELCDRATRGLHRPTDGPWRVIKVLVVFGTRPEAIKMAPVVQALEMLAGVLQFCGLSADDELSIMKPEQALAYVTAAVLTGVQGVLAAEKT